MWSKSVNTLVLGVTCKHINFHTGLESWAGTYVLVVGCSQKSFRYAVTWQKKKYMSSQPPASTYAAVLTDCWTIIMIVACTLLCDWSTGNSDGCEYWATRSQMEARWLLLLIIIPIRLFNVRPHSIVKWVDIVARRTRPCLPTAKDLLTLRCKDGGGGWMDDGDDMATRLIIRLQVEPKLKAPSEEREGCRK